MQEVAVRKPCWSDFLRAINNNQPIIFFGIIGIRAPKILWIIVPEDENDGVLEFEQLLEYSESYYDAYTQEYASYNNYWMIKMDKDSIQGITEEDVCQKIQPYVDFEAYKIFQAKITETEIKRISAVEYIHHPFIDIYLHKGLCSIIDSYIPLLTYNQGQCFIKKLFYTKQPFNDLHGKPADVSNMKININDRLKFSSVIKERLETYKNDN